MTFDDTSVEALRARVAALEAERDRLRAPFVTIAEELAATPPVVHTAFGAAPPRESWHALDKANDRIAALEAERDRLDDGIEIAFGIIANAGGGDWTQESVQWQEAAARWRDAFYGPHCARRAALAAGTAAGREEQP
jgi:uncharacterized small protein (DUF1192 family)